MMSGMDQPPPTLAYATQVIDVEEVLRRIRRAVAWVAILYGAVSVAQATMSMITMYNVMNTIQFAPPYPREYHTSYLASIGFRTTCCLVMILAGSLMLKDVNTAVRLLRVACWVFIFGGAIAAIAIPIYVASPLNQWASGLSYAMSFLTSSALPVLMLLLPLRLSLGTAGRL